MARSDEERLRSDNLGQSSEAGSYERNICRGSGNKLETQGNELAPYSPKAGVKPETMSRVHCETRRVGV